MWRVNLNSRLEAEMTRYLSAFAASVMAGTALGIASLPANASIVTVTMTGTTASDSYHQTTGGTTYLTTPTTFTAQWTIDTALGADVTTLFGPTYTGGRIGGPSYLAASPVTGANFNSSLFSYSFVSTPTSGYAYNYDLANDHRTEFDGESSSSGVLIGIDAFIRQTGADTPDWNSPYLLGSPGGATYAQLFYSNSNTGERWDIHGVISTLEISVAGAVPEASTWAMMILGFAGVGLMTYRRRNRASAMRIRFITTLVFALVVGSLRTQGAPLVDQGSNTFDPNTGLSWLDTSLTANISYNNVTADLIAAGGIYEGYRYATPSEVDQLAIDAGIAGVGFIANPSDPDVANLIALLGGPTVQNGFITILGLTANIIDPGYHDLYQLYYSDTIRIARDAFADWSDTQHDPSSASFLVMTAVPESSTWAMMILGFFGIGFVSHFRKRYGSGAAACPSRGLTSKAASYPVRRCARADRLTIRT
jgi:hypothetical protein